MQHDSIETMDYVTDLGDQTNIVKHFLLFIFTGFYIGDRVLVESISHYTLY